MSLSRVARSALVSCCLIISLFVLCAFTSPMSQPTATNTTTTAGTSSATSSDTTGSSASAPSITIEKTSDSLGANGNFVDVVTIHTTTIVDHVDAQVKDDSGALLYVASADSGTLVDGTTAPARKISVKPSSANGAAKISVITKATAGATLRITPFDSKGPLPDDATDVTLVSGSTVDSLGSKSSYLQLFVGTTFTNNYDSDGKASGFGSAGQLIRLTFDTLWPHVGKSPKDHIHTFTHGAWHTYLNLEFSKFPFGDALNPPTTGTTGTTPPTTTATDTTGTNSNGLADSFSGSFGGVWQPNGWAHFDKRDPKNMRTNDDFAYDAYRWGLFGSAGATTRSQRAKYSQNSTIDRVQYGLRFTHTRSKVDSPEKEDRDIEPIRFVEISYGRFSEFEGRTHVNRLVIDGGLRLEALSNDVFPIYLGVHMNTGPGPDDLRVFIGVLLKLDKLGALVEKATGH
jgi:hypothetical protein